MYVLLGLYAAPILLYLLVFGPRLSANHQIWAEFGSAMAGIYAPIVALTTLAVLLAQVRLQSQINNHQYDQAYIVQARADIDFYATRLEVALHGLALPGVTVRDFLHKHFQAPGLTDLDAEDSRLLAKNLDLNIPSIFGMWGAIYPILAGLNAKENAFFEMTVTSSKQRLVALLSFETCVCLENFYRVRTEGKLGVPYAFSPLLS